MGEEGVVVEQAVTVAQVTSGEVAGKAGTQSHSLLYALQWRYRWQ